MREEKSTPFSAVARVVALIATASIVMALGEHFLNAAPIPETLQGKCCGGLAEDCCGCIFVGGGFNYFQRGTALTDV